MLDKIIDFLNTIIIRRCDDGLDPTDLVCDKQLLQHIVDLFIERYSTLEIPDVVFYIAVVHTYYCIYVLEYYNTELYKLAEIIRFVKLTNANNNEKYIHTAVTNIVMSNDVFYKGIRRDLLGIYTHHL